MNEVMPETVANVTPEENKFFDAKIVDGNVEVTLDTDKDGEASIKLVVVGSELVSEALAKIKDIL